MKSNTKNPMMMAIMAGIVLLIILFFYGGTHGWFNFSLNINAETKNQLNSNQQNNPSCSASLSRSTINFGEPITGTIKDGSNTLCSVYGKMVGTDDWRKIAEGVTDSKGYLTFTDTINVAGTFDFRVICGNCVTNIVTLIVNPAPSGSCRDTDGKNKMTAGFVQDASGTYYDDCAGNWAVTEYWCNGDVMASQVIGCDAGYICFETRGGDYCKPTTPATQYYCCLAMGVESCYEGGCPPAGTELGVYGTLPECQADCGGSADAGGYTCGGFLRWCSTGTCPSAYYCELVSSLATTGCACVDRLGNLHPDWLAGGQYFVKK